MGNTLLVVRMPFHRFYIYMYRLGYRMPPQSSSQVLFHENSLWPQNQKAGKKQLTSLYIQWSWHFTQVRCPSFPVISVSPLRRRWSVKTEGRAGREGEADKRPSPHAGSWAFQAPELNLCDRNMVSFDMNATSHILFFKSFYTPTPGSLFYSSLKNRGSSLTTPVTEGLRAG